MVTISTGTRDRLLAVSTRCFGPRGESLLQSVAQQTFDKPLNEVSYAEIPGLLEAVNRAACAQDGNEAVASLAAALNQLQDDVDAGFSGRLAGLLTSRVGAATEPLLNGACAQLGVPPEALDASRLSEVAALIYDAASTLFGAESAVALRESLLNVASAKPPSLTPQILALAREHLGDEGDAILDRLCRDHLEIALDDLDAASVRLLAVAVERHGQAVVGTALPTTFVADASEALASPSAPLRKRIVDLTRDVVGPLAPDFLEEVCLEHGMPFQAVDYEHLMWLAEVLRAEVEPLAGRSAADGLARELRAFLTGKR